jgi:hypothetical protein
VPAWASSEAERQAERLLEVSNMDRVMEESMALTLDMQLQSDPRLLPMRGVLEQFFRKHMSFQSFKADFVQIYVKVFSAEELSALADFYATPVGQKALRVLPQLTAEGMQLGATRVRAHEAELREAIEAELRRQQQTAN